jgi:hypothetical protein
LPDVLLTTNLTKTSSRWIPLDSNDIVDYTALSNAYWRLASTNNNDSDPVLTPLSQLDPASFIFNNYRLISYEDTYTFGEPSNLILFKEAFFIISMARVENGLDSAYDAVKMDPTNYLYCRMAGGAPYYSFRSGKFQFESQGSIHYGSNNIIAFTTQPVRIAFHDK